MHVQLESGGLATTNDKREIINLRLPSPKQPQEKTWQAFFFFFFFFLLTRKNPKFAPLSCMCMHQQISLKFQHVSCPLSSANLSKDSQRKYIKNLFILNTITLGRVGGCTPLALTRGVE